jgi:hypothetical protein
MQCTLCRAGLHCILFLVSLYVLSIQLAYHPTCSQQLTHDVLNYGLALDVLPTTISMVDLMPKLRSWLQHMMWSPVAHLYLRGPWLTRSWRGSGMFEICAQLTNVPVGHWMRHGGPYACCELIHAEIDSWWILLNCILYCWFIMLWMLYMQCAPARRRSQTGHVANHSRRKVLTRAAIVRKLNKLSHTVEPKV